MVLQRSLLVLFVLINILWHHGSVKMQWFRVVNLNKNKPAQGIFFFPLCIKREKKKRKLKCIMRHSMFLVLGNLDCCYKI